MDKDLIKILNNLNKMLSDPHFIDQMIESEKKRIEWAKKSYYQKLKFYEENSEWVVEFRVKGDRDSGWSAYRRNSREGKEILARQLKEKKDEEKRIWESENPLDAALDHVLEMGIESIDRAELRKISDQFMSFDLDRFSSFQTMVTDEGIEVK